MLLWLDDSDREMFDLDHSLEDLLPVFCLVSVNFQGCAFDRGIFTQIHKAAWLTEIKFLCLTFGEDIGWKRHWHIWDCLY